jgi:predicted nucleic acid-binding protein
MSGFLLDTNVPSELIRIKPDPRVAQWLRDADDNTLHLSVISIGEVCKGFTVHPEERRRVLLRKWLDETLRPWFAGRILPVSEEIAERWGILEGQCQRRGLAVSAPDGLIAATALEHDLTIVTRNSKDFAGLGVTVFNPWNL